MRFRAKIIPHRPAPRRSMVEGSGTAGGLSEKEPAWMKTPESRIKSPASAMAMSIWCSPAPIPEAVAVRSVVSPSYWVSIAVEFSLSL
jgi:hypothetical protein